MSWAIAAAVAGALAVAAGAALQERTVITAPTSGISQFRLLRHLAHSPRWLVGTALTVSGVGAHMWALGHAPLTVIQPINMSGLLFAVVLSAFFHKRKLSRSQVVGSLAVTVGLVSLLSVLPYHTETPDFEHPALSMLPGVALLVLLACLAIARYSGDAVQAWTLALGGGVAYAVTSALARVIGLGVLEDPLNIVRPLTAVALVVGLCGALVVQNAYRTHHFALAYATLLISDPITAGIIGVAFFGEPLPEGPMNGVIAAVATAVIMAGTVTLAKSTRPAKAAVTVPLLDSADDEDGEAAERPAAEPDAGDPAAADSAPRTAVRTEAGQARTGPRAPAGRAAARRQRAEPGRSY
ncbi:hypothetical protein CLV63_105184 [Murinocardiopsis flavida]|uniref:Magnesium transporter NIPA n=1 Tax=Murinocardiopsis flavida TaxID=645275 RepID=A0A2P8DMR7_9ACTN|nr:DMT family transporter [Murinocardiopsis flavida]PSK98510.1 hypothetical protein CLV63_105184 [Murinocardiopsis flavida]